MRTLRRLVASLGAAMALGLAMTGVTLAADPLDVDVSAILDGDVDADVAVDLLDSDTEADAAIDADAVLDGDAVLDAVLDADIDADAVLDADIDADAVLDADADAADDARVTGFLALDLCTRLALLDRADSCALDTPGSSGAGDATLNADATLDAALDHGLIGPDDGTLAATAAADACVRLALFGDAGACDAAAPGDGTSDADDSVVEALAKFAAAADAAVTDEGTAATAALEACASMALFGDASACRQAGAPGDGDETPSSDDQGTALDDGSGTAPGSVSRPDAAAGEGPGGSLPDTASLLVGEPFAPIALFLVLLAGSAALRRMRIGAR